MKIWKRAIPFGLAAVLAAAGPAAVLAASPEFSKTEEEWARLRDNVLEYDEIAELVHEYNTTVDANRADYARTKRKTVEDVTEDYWKAAEQYGNAIFYSSDDMSAATAKLNQRQAENAAADNVNDGEIDRLTYAKAEAGIVKQAQQLMNTYHQQLLKRQLEENNKNYQERLLNAAAAKQGAGTATSVDILNAQQSVYNSQAEIISLDAQIEDSRQNLALMTGWKQDGQPDIQGMPEIDFSRIDRMDPETDKELAMQNDYTLAIEKRRLNNASYTDTQKLYSTNVSKLEESIKSAVDLSYQNTLQARTAYEQAQLSLTVANNNLNAGARKLQVGMVSQLDYEDLVYKQQTAQTTYQLKEMELFQALENYDWLLAGLASS